MANLDHLKVPTIHWNGTSKQALEGEYARAYSAVNVAIDALTSITVHDRDYYVQDKQAGPQARAEHVIRLAHLENVKDELEHILIEIQKQEGR